MSALDPPQALAALLDSAGERLARRWGRAVFADVQNPLGVNRADIASASADSIEALRRQLSGSATASARGEEVPRLWGEAIRHHGGTRFEQHFTMSELAREFELLVGVLSEEWKRAYGAPSVAALSFLMQIGFAGMAAAGDDYVRRVRASRTTMRENAPIESIVRHMVEGLIAVEAEGTISFVTPAAAAILGLSEEELVGAGAKAMEAIVQRLDVCDELGQRVRVEELPFREALATGRPSRERWLRLKRPGERKERIVHTQAIPILEHDELRGVVETFRDRTEEYHQQEALARAHAEMRKLNVEVVRSTRARVAGELVGRVTGTLNNVMNAIQLRCRLAARSQMAGEHLEAVEASIAEVGGLLARLQELAEPHREQAGEPVDLDELVSEALALARPELAAPLVGHGLKVELDLGAPLPVFARRADLRELAIHLLLPAFDERAAGELLYIATGGNQARAWLRIKYPAPAVVSEAALAAARNLAESWQGHLDLADTEVTVDLPVALGAAPRTRSVPSPKAVRSVLIADDDADNREMLAALLEAHGFSTTVARTGDEAIAQGRAGRLDAALVDLAMPDRSGWEIVRALRQVQPELLIALVTGYEATVSEAPPGAAVDAVFRKPLDMTSLLGFLGLQAERTASP